MKSLLQYASNRYSQNGEDGILEEILRRLGIADGWFCEFGAWDAKHMSNTYALLEKGWKGVDIEGHKLRYQDLLKAAEEWKGMLYPVEAYVSARGGEEDSLDALLAQTPIPRDFEVLSVDVDSTDWWIWRSLTEYSPKIVVIEINSAFAPGEEFVYEIELAPSDSISVPMRPDAGSTFTAMLKLGKTKGYTLACHTGNMIFVRNDLADKLALPKSELEDPDSLFLDSWVGNIPKASMKHKIARMLGYGVPRI